MTLVTAGLRLGAQNACPEAGTRGQGPPGSKPEKSPNHRRTQAGEGRLARLREFQATLGKKESPRLPPTPPRPRPPPRQVPAARKSMARRLTTATSGETALGAPAKPPADSRAPGTAH